MGFVFYKIMIPNQYQPEDFTKYRYVIYARKSSEESDRQLRSLDDQVKECQQLAKRLGLRVVGVVRESKSAKKPHKRSEFTSLLKKIEDGKVDGIIAWAPDRLARNMLEAGMVIDMIDEQKIKDLRFATYPFSKDANGLMLLGLSFVLSKQYSDKLSQDVTRGKHNSFLDGKASGATKHGYNKNSLDYFVPNENFYLLQNAWQKRLQGESLVKITDWLNKSGYLKKYQVSKREVAMTKQKLSLIFNDSFYYGVIKMKHLTVDLRLIPEANFQPMISEEEFNHVQKTVKGGKIVYLRQPNKFGLMPLKNVVRCAECGNACMVYPSKSKSGQRYLYYTCRTPECKRCGKATRGKVIFDWLYDFLKDGFNVSKKDYEDLMRSRKKNLPAIKNALEAEIRQLEIRITKQRQTIDNISIGILDVQSEVVKKSLEKQIDEKQAELETMLTDLEKKKQHKKELAGVDITWDKFVNTTKNIGNIIKNGDKRQKDAIGKIIFVNIFVNTEKVAKYDLREPFLTLLNRTSNEVVLSGRGAGIRTRSKCSQNTRASR